MSAQPKPSFLASRRGRRTIFAVSLLVLVAGVAAATIAFFGNTGKSLESPKSNEAANIFTPRKQIPLDKDARRVAGRFILTAVARKSLAESYELKQEWLTGNIPVQYYPADRLETATFKVDESYPDEAILEVALLPEKTVKVEPQIFYIGLKKVGAGAASEWKVNYWLARVPLQIPNARD